MLTIYKKVEFAAAHHIEGYEGNCHRPHGHNYVAEIWVWSNQYLKQANNIFVDFAKIKEIVMEWDHQDLNEILQEHNTTAELLSMYLGNKLYNYLKTIYPSNIGDIHIKVRLWETSTSYCEFEL